MCGVRRVRGDKSAFARRGSGGHHARRDFFTGGSSCPVDEASKTRACFHVDRRNTAIRDDAATDSKPAPGAGERARARYGSVRHRARRRDSWTAKTGETSRERSCNHSGTGRYSFFFHATARQIAANTASNRKPQVKAPVVCFTPPTINGGKNPPRPPAAPTKPVTLPTD